MGRSRKSFRLYLPACRRHGAPYVPVCLHSRAGATVSRIPQMRRQLWLLSSLTVQLELSPAVPLDLRDQLRALVCLAKAMVKGQSFPKRPRKGRPQARQPCRSLALAPLRRPVACANGRCTSRALTKLCQCFLGCGLNFAARALQRSERHTLQAASSRLEPILRVRF